jgi:hypothetical protein
MRFVKLTETELGTLQEGHKNFLQFQGAESLQMPYLFSSRSRREQISAVL